jgi:histidinol-phosphate aminotransferase
VFFNTGRPVEPQIEALRARGVQVGRPFPPLTQWMRVSIGTLEEMRRFVREYEAVRT